MSKTKTGSTSEGKALVTGGAGFIGSHLCEILIAQNQPTLCLDDLSTGSIKNISHLQSSPLFSFIEADIKEFDFSQLGKINYIFHLSGLEAVLKEAKPSLDTLLINSIGTKRLLDLAHSSSAKILYASTTDIYSGVASSLSLDLYYGKSLKDEVIFSHHEAKRFGEALVEEFRANYKIDARVVRIADVYGPRMSLDSLNLVNQLFSQAIRRQKLKIPNDGLQIIFPTYVADVVYGIQRAMFLEETQGKIYYLVNPQQVKATELAEALSRTNEPKLEIEFEKSDEIFLPSPNVTIQSSKTELNWQPKISLKDGITRTLDWFKKGELKSPDEKTVAKEAPPTPIEVNDKEDKPHEPRKRFRERLAELKNQISGSISSLSLPKKREKKEETRVVKPETEPKSKKEGQPEKTKRPGNQIVKILKPLILGLSLLLIILGVASPVFLTGFFSLKGVGELRAAEADLKGFDFDQAQGKLALAQKSFRTANYSFEDLMWLASLFHARDLFQDVNYLLSAAENVSNSLASASAGAKPLIESAKSLLAAEGEAGAGNLEKTSGISEIEFALAAGKLAEAQAKIQSVDKTRFPGFILVKIEEIESQVLMARALLDRASQANQLLPLIAGQNKEKVYLLVFQNNMERRPTGGFIGSYAKLVLSEGKIKEITVDDVYNPDNQILGQFSPPVALKELLGVESWGMRDANWSPDFNTSAEEITRLYEAATGEKVEGVVALDLYFFQSLLNFLGPIEVEDSDGEKVTGDNLFAKAEYQAEVGFEPGSTQKKDFLGKVGFKIIERLRSLPFEDWSSLSGVFKENFDRRHLLLHFKEPAVQELVSAQGWGGEILKTTGDYLMVIDSNVGGNKTDYFIQRKIDYTVGFDKDGKPQSTLVLTYKNESLSNAWPGGSYKNYLRVHAPEGSKLVSSEGLSRETAYSQAEQSGKTIFEGLVEVEVGSEKQIKFTYTLPELFNLAETVNAYNLLVQKQSGASSNEFTLNLTWPQYLELAQKNVEGEISPQKYTFSGQLDKDQEIHILLQQLPD